MTAARSIAAPSDSPNKAWLRALEMTSGIEANPRRIFPRVLEDLGARFGDAPALLSEHESFSHADLAARARRYARWALAEKIEKGETVALLMRGRAEYLAIWAGLTRVGVVVALINTSLTGDALAHCLGVAKARHVIVDDELAARLDDISCNAKIWRHGFADRYSDAPLADERDVVLNDPALLIYTSGTTGLPKAAIVSHYRVMMWTHWFAGLMGARADDRLYNCLPMYHSVGGVVASGAVLLAGGSVILRQKFSASGFWQDVSDSGATIFQYIGELCRYLLAGAGPQAPHNLRLACGNGLSGDVWEQFQGRFGLPQILEFYASTEGNFSLYNVEGKVGAIGRIPPFLAHRFAVALLQIGPDGEPLRGPDGFCQRGEAGEAVGKIASGPARFEGYSDTAATAKKILRNVFAPGDAWMRTGDLMRKDAQGFFHFLDRLGDTFRWKGENVATTEVAATLAQYPGVLSAHVYGVAVPHADGKAGMAALETSTDFDLAGLPAYLARLPAYARPIFLRLGANITHTDTFKPQKQKLASEGFDPAVITDPLYVDKGRGYETLDAELYARISAGLIRL